jgi:hypothetical protein
VDPQGCTQYVPQVRRQKLSNGTAANGYGDYPYESRAEILGQHQIVGLCWQYCKRETVRSGNIDALAFLNCNERLCSAIGYNLVKADKAERYMDQSLEDRVFWTSPGGRVLPVRQRMWWPEADA